MYSAAQHAAGVQSWDSVQVPVAQSSVRFRHDALLLFCPGVLVDALIQMVVVALTALLSATSLCTAESTDSTQLDVRWCKRREANFRVPSMHLR